MALICCYECGKEISSLAAACPSCGAPPQPATIPPPLPRQASRVKKLSLGTIALLTGVLLVLVIRGVTNEANSVPVKTSPMPATGQATTTSSPPVETASQSSTTLTTTRTPTEEATTMSSPAAETASQNAPTLTTTETPSEEPTTTSSPPVETASQSSPSLTTTENPHASDVSETTAPPPRATYQVIGIPVTDHLNVREGAGSDYQVVTKLEPGTGSILLGTKHVVNGATTWQEITVHGQTGWVNAAYIGLETQSPTSPGIVNSP